MYETHEARDRDVSSFEANEIGKALNNENIYLNDYQATFATYSDRDGFDLRSNNNSSQEFLDESIKLTKSEKNTQKVTMLLTGEKPLRKIKKKLN
jgi:hypothetical protein